MQKRLLAVCSVPMFHSHIDALPHERKYTFSHHERFGIILENTADSVKRANALLFTALINYIHPEEPDSINELKNAGLMVLPSEPTESMTDKEDFASFIRSFGFQFSQYQGYNLIGFALPNDPKFGAVNDEFAGEFRCNGFEWNCSVDLIGEDKGINIDLLINNAQVYSEEFNLHHQNIINALGTAVPYFAPDVIATPTIIHPATDYTAERTIPEFSPICL